MYNPEPLATLGTQDTGQGQTEQKKTHNTIQCKKLKRWAPQSPPESQGWTQVLTKCSHYIFALFMSLTRHKQFFPFFIISLKKCINFFFNIFFSHNNTYIKILVNNSYRCLTSTLFTVLPQRWNIASPV